MMDGALSRMSLMKRTTSPKRLPRLYSARNVPARMPVGVPIRVAIRVITTLPKIAFNSPPALPGGGVIWLNSAGVIAAIPFSSRVHSTRTSHNSPKAVAMTDKAMTKPLTIRRRAYMSMGSASCPPLQSQQHQFCDRQRDQRRQIEIANRLGEFIRQRGRNRRPRLQDRGADTMRVADDKRDGHRLAERAAEAEHDAADNAGASEGQHDVPDDLSFRGTEGIGAFLEDRRHGLEHIAHDRRDERQHHDRQDEAGSEDADAERRAGEQRADPRYLPERIDDRGLDILLDERGEYEETPDAVNDAGDRRQQLDHRCERPLQPERADLGDEHRDPERNRNTDQHRDGRSDDGPVDRRERPELLGHRVPDFGEHEREPEGTQRRDRTLDQGDDDAAEDQQNEQCEEERQRTKNRVADRAAALALRG